MLVICILALPLVFVAVALVLNDLPWSSPPGVITRLVQYLGNNDIRTSVDSTYPELRTRVYQLKEETLFDLARKAVSELGWEIIKDDRETLSIHALVTTRLFRFKDDVVITITDDGMDKYIVNLHSSSRVGKGDLGANTRHVINFYNTLDRIVSNKDKKTPQ